MEKRIMLTHIRIDDDQLVQRAMELGGHRTKNAAVAEALTEYIRNRKQDKIRDSLGVTGFPRENQRKRDR
jgi:Arc/MetJ family transcription regulator